MFLFQFQPNILCGYRIFCSWRFYLTHDMKANIIDTLPSGVTQAKSKTTSFRAITSGTTLCSGNNTGSEIAR